MKNAYPLQTERRKISTRIAAGLLSSTILTSCAEGNDFFEFPDMAPPTYQEVTLGDLAADMADGCPVDTDIQLTDVSLAAIDAAASHYDASVNGQVIQLEMGSNEAPDSLAGSWVVKGTVAGDPCRIVVDAIVATG